MIDVVIPLGTGSCWNNHWEIRMCLRSLETNFKEMGNVYIVGFKPPFLKNVIHIEAEDIWKQNKDANIIDKVLMACNREELSDKFLRLSDDQLLLKPMFYHEIKPLYVEDLKDIEKWQKSRWRNRLKNTFDVLLAEGKTTYNYESHIPQIYDKYEFKRIMAMYKYQVEGGGYTINTLYFNNVDVERIKRSDEIKANFETSKPTMKTIRKSITPDTCYIGYNDLALFEDLKQVIEEIFPNPSKFES